MNLVNGCINIHINIDPYILCNEILSHLKFRQMTLLKYGDYPLHNDAHLFIILLMTQILDLYISQS